MPYIFIDVTKNLYYNITIQTLEQIKKVLKVGNNQDPSTSYKPHSVIILVLICQMLLVQHLTFCQLQYIT